MTYGGATYAGGTYAGTVTEQTTTAVSESVTITGNASVPAVAETATASESATVTGAASTTATETATATESATATGNASVPALAETGTASENATITGGAAVSTAETATATEAATITGSASVSVTETLGTIAEVLAPDTLTVDWNASATHTLIWDAAQTVTITMADNTITQQTVPAEGENIERTINVEEDGSAKDIGGASVSWYLLPDSDSANSDAQIDDDTTGVSYTITDAGAGETTLSVNQGVTDGLDGRWWQRVVVDDSGDGKQVWGGRFIIEEA